MHARHPSHFHLMNPQPPSSIHSLLSGRISWSLATAIILAAALLSPPVRAQSANNFNTRTITPPSTSNKKEKAAAPTSSGDAGPVSNTPSRYVGEAELEGYIESLSAVFSMRNRTTDPFGQFQDPDAKPIIKTPLAKTSRRATPSAVVPFSDIIGRIKVTTVRPGEKCFLIGTREFKQGGRMPINFRTKAINAEVVSVTSQQIDFRNLDTGESASIKINLLPVGMTPGTGEFTAPGMVLDRPNAPIELDAGPSLEENPQNR